MNKTQKIIMGLGIGLAVALLLFGIANGASLFQLYQGGTNNATYTGSSSLIYYDNNASKLNSFSRLKINDFGTNATHPTELYFQGNSLSGQQTRFYIDSQGSGDAELDFGTNGGLLTHVFNYNAGTYDISYDAGIIAQFSQSIAVGSSETNDLSGILSTDFGGGNGVGVALGGKGDGEWIVSDRNFGTPTDNQDGIDFYTDYIRRGYFTNGGDLFVSGRSNTDNDTGIRIGATDLPTYTFNSTNLDRNSIVFQDVYGGYNDAGAIIWASDWETPGDVNANLFEMGHNPNGFWEFNASDQLGATGPDNDLHNIISIDGYKGTYQGGHVQFTADEFDISAGNTVFSSALASGVNFGDGSTGADDTRVNKYLIELHDSESNAQSGDSTLFHFTFQDAGNNSERLVAFGSRVEATMTSLGTGFSNNGDLIFLTMHAGKSLNADSTWASGTIKMVLSSIGDLIIGDHGTNKVTAGDFFTLTGWSGTTNWSIEAVTYNQGAKHASGSTVALNQNISLTAGHYYQLQYDIKTIPAGTLTASAGGITFATRSTVGSYSEVFKASSTANLTFTPTSTFTGVFGNVMVFDITDFHKVIGSEGYFRDGITVPTITAPGTNAIGVILDYYGNSATRVLTTPTTWLTIKGDDGVTYKVPGY